MLEWITDGLTTIEVEIFRRTFETLLLWLPARQPIALSELQALHPHFLSICPASLYLFGLCGVPVLVLSSFHTWHRLLSVYTRKRDSVCVTVTLLSRVIMPYRSIIPLSSFMA